MFGRFCSPSHKWIWKGGEEEGGWGKRAATPVLSCIFEKRLINNIGKVGWLVLCFAKNTADTITFPLKIGELYQVVFHVYESLSFNVSP